VKDRYLSSRAFQRLREKAEWLVKEGKRKIPDIDQDDLVKLTHELEIYHTELEVQNEELRHAKAELETSRNEFFDLYESAPVAYLTLSKQGIIEKANQAGRRMFKNVGNSFIGSNFHLKIFAEDFPVYYSLMNQLGSNRNAGPVELRLKRDGKPLYVQVEAKAKIDEKGELEWRLALVDITGRKLSERALRESEEQLRIAVESGRLGTWNRNVITGEASWNRYLYELLGRDPDGPPVTGQTFFRYIHPDDIDRVNRHVDETIRNGTDFFDEFRIVREDKAVCWLAASARVYRDENGRPVRLAGVNYDITDRKQAEELVRQSHAELETRVVERTAELNKKKQELQRVNRKLLEEIDKRKKFELELKDKGEKILAAYRQRDLLSKKLVDMLEKERHDIGSTLHDQIGQILTGMTIRLEGLKKVQTADGSDLSDRVEPIQSLLRNLILQAKTISQNLRSDVLERFGLEASIRQMVKDVQKQSGLKINLFTKNLSGDIREDGTDLAVYRLIQEALTNVVKHAGAKEVFISLSRRDKFVSLTIEDDGKGFDYDAVLDKKAFNSPLGITIMRERVSMLGGEFRIESEPDKGTHIHAQIPLDR